MDTGIKCGCGGNVVVQNGSETAKQLACAACGSYLYYVGTIACCCPDYDSPKGLPHITRRKWEKLCGDAELTPEASAKIHDSIKRGLLG